MTEDTVTYRKEGKDRRYCHTSESGKKTEDTVTHPKEGKRQKILLHIGKREKRQKILSLDTS